MPEVQCSLCLTRFDIELVGGNFSAETSKCTQCYRVGIKVDPRVWCFGKKQMYDPKSAECAPTGGCCIDRRICRLVVTGQLELSENFPIKAGNGTD